MLAAVLSLMVIPTQDPDLIVPPMVQLGTGKPNSVVLIWHTTESADGYSLTFSQGNKPVEVDSTSKTLFVEGKSPRTIHTATLTNLKPGIRVDYTLSKHAQIVSQNDFVAPKSTDQPYTFGVFGDFGTGTKIQGQVVYQAYKANPDLFVLTGDLVYNKGRYGEYETRFFPYLASQTVDPERGVPLMSRTLTVGVPGNHDILDRDFDASPEALSYFYFWNQPLNGPLTQNGEKNTATLKGPQERQAAFLKNAGAAYPRMSNFSFDYANAHWTCLDANPYVDWTDPKLRSWLRQDLAKAKNKTWRFVAFHQPGFHSSASHQSEKQMRLVADIFEDAKVDIVFCGHVHNYQRTKPIQVGQKRNQPAPILNRDDWPTDEKFDGKTNTKPKGVIYIVSGAGSAGLYNQELNDHPLAWKPFQAEYIAKWGLTLVKVSGGRLTLTQIDTEGKTLDQITVTK